MLAELTSALNAKSGEEGSKEARAGHHQNFERRAQQRRIDNSACHSKHQALSHLFTNNGNQTKLPLPHLHDNRSLSSLHYPHLLPHPPSTSAAKKKHTPARSPRRASVHSCEAQNHEKRRKEEKFEGVRRIQTNETPLCREAQNQAWTTRETRAHGWRCRISGVLSVWVYVFPLPSVSSLTLLHLSTLSRKSRRDPPSEK